MYSAQPNGADSATINPAALNSGMRALFLYLLSLQYFPIVPPSLRAPVARFLRFLRRYVLKFWDLEGVKGEAVIASSWGTTPPLFYPYRQSSTTTITIITHILP